MKLNNDIQTNGSTSALLLQSECCTLPFVQLWNEDCRNTLERIETGSIDLLLQDTPFGVTQNDWDKKPDFSIMWQQWKRVVKFDGAMIFFGTQPFASELIQSNLKHFKYEVVWEKDRATGHLNSKKQPLKAHENYYIFYRKQPTYNPQMWIGEKPSNKSSNKRVQSKSTNYGNFNNYQRGGNLERFPRSVVKYNVVNSLHGYIHPTQKPLELIENIIKTYSNKGDTVFDGYSGSGTTAAACIKEKRHFIGSELNKEYYDLSVKRLTEMSMQAELF